MKITRPLKVFFVFLIVCLFGAFSFGTFAEKGSIENRTLASWKNVTLELNSPGQFVSDLTRVFEDNFVFRTSLIKVANFIDLNFFRAGSVGQFVIGKSGWEFYAGDENLIDQAGLKKLTGSQLYEITNNVNNTLRQLDQQGVKATIFVVPNKASVYPENLPNRYRKSGSFTRAEQIFKLKNKNQALKNLVFEKDFYLLNKKALGFDIYEKKGSHWNDLGAYLGYKILLKNIGLLPRPLSDFDIFDRPDYQPLSSTYKPTFNNFGYLNSPVLVLKNNKQFNRNLVVQNSDEISPKVCCEGEGQPSFRIYERKNTKDPSLLVFGDSFSDKLLPFLLPHFSRVTFVASRFIDHKLVQELAPDYVVHEISERFFSNVYLLPNPTLDIEYQRKSKNIEFEELKNHFKLEFTDNVFKSNLEESLIIASINQKELDLQSKLNEKGILASSFLQRGQVILDFARVEPKRLNITLNGKFIEFLPSKSGNQGSDSSILSVTLNGHEAKVSFNKNGIFVGGAVTNILAGKMSLQDILRIELILNGTFATLYLNGKKYTTWESGASNGPSRVLFGDFSQHSSKDFSYSLAGFEINAGY
jgi:alginate O-acetyltransferase complex protein AlgJ